MTATLVPSLSLSDMLPSGTAFAPRTDKAQTRLLGLEDYHLETVTMVLMGLLNGLPTVRHRAGATDMILRFLQEAGLNIAEQMFIYDSDVLAYGRATDLVARGHRLWQIYPLPANMHRPESHLVAPELWFALNSKAKMSRLVDPAHLANRGITSMAAAKRAGFTRPVWVKLAGPDATGFGEAVRYCPDSVSFDAALTALGVLDPGTDIIIEDDIPVTTSWCANIIVQPQTVHLAGGATQVFSAPGVQSGSLIDPDLPLPDAAAAIAVAAGHAARKRGFIGPAGLDIGQTPDGRFVVFDPNFRVNGSLAQVLLHASAAGRAGLSVSGSVNMHSALPVPEIIRRVTGPVKDQWFVPLRVIDAAYLPSAKGISQISGFVMAGQTADLPARQAELTALLDA